MRRQKACLDSSNENGYGDASFGLGKKQECVLNSVYGLDNLIVCTGDLKSPGIGL